MGWGKAMSKAIKDGGPAFPVADFDHQTFAPKNVDEAKRLLSGMTLRDYFAAKAMAAFLIANPSQNYSGPLSDFAADAYDMADAMLEARTA